MVSPVYDLRSNAKTKGNRAYLNPRLAILMKLGYALLVVDILIFAFYSGWGFYQRWQTRQMDLDIAQKQAQIQSQERILWFFDWKDNTLPMQELLVELFGKLPEDMHLSELSLNLASDGKTLQMKVAINSEKNTSAQYFRELSTYFKDMGLEIVSIQQTQAIGATVFEARMMIDHSRINTRRQMSLMKAVAMLQEKGMQ
ncbi:MAG: hypothetical protein JW739_07435 [Opitutales bacterium]|nr:hypothetical protein [Opitutales bacterium]